MLNLMVTLICLSLAFLCGWMLSKQPEGHSVEKGLIWLLYIINMYSLATFWAFVALIPAIAYISLFVCIVIEIVGFYFGQKSSEEK